MKSLTTIVLLTLSIAIKGQNQIPYIQAPVAIDGRLSESTWSEIEATSNFQNYMPIDHGRAEQQTYVKFFHDGNFLYVGVKYEDTEARIQTSSMKRDVSIGLSDSFILILDTQNQQQNAYYFAVNGYGTQVDGLVERINEGFDFSLSWNTIWKAAAFVDGTDKYYEMAIPLKSLNYDIEHPTFGIQMYTRDIKKNAWTIMKPLSRNYRLFDLRFTTPFTVEHLPAKTPSRFAVTGSMTANHQHDIENSEKSTAYLPSLDVQYNITSALKMDLTVNPDFSQIDVDQQVTNLTRFSIFFPERRNFFLENSDLFSNLGVDDVNPFYSRRIGANSNIQFGAKLSGNLNSKTRMGILNVQSSSVETTQAQNYSSLVLERQLNKNFTATGFLINRQGTESLEFSDDFNRVTGLNFNYKSDNNKWIGLANYATSLNDELSGENDFYHLGIWYNQRGLAWNAGVKKLDRNYITDIGFTPRLYNYDAFSNEVTRIGYTQTNASLEYEKFFDQSSILNSIRVVNFSNDNYFDEEGKLTQTVNYINSAVFFKNLSAIYYVYTHQYIRLDFGFDPLRNGNPISPDDYSFGHLKVGFNSANNQKFRYRFNVERGNYYNGKRNVAGTYLNYQLLPFSNFELSYEMNQIDLAELGEETFHLLRFTGEVFINTRLNWTTYIQYNTQADNFNINSRFQWEYRPLSYVYFVVTDNYDQFLSRRNWGGALKVNYRFDF